MPTSTKERPIIFSAPMIRALLNGEKSQTRRLVKPQPDVALQEIAAECRQAMALGLPYHDPGMPRSTYVCPYGQPGDRLWVRESGWQPKEPTLHELREGADTWPKWAYAADNYSQADLDEFRAWGWKSRPSIHMPRLASRITLQLTDVRAQRLQEISEEDARAEGAEPAVAGRDERGPIRTYRTGFVGIWQHLNVKRAPWESNPWVWALTFRRVTP